MYRLVTIITIQQQPSDKYPDRKAVLNFDFVHEFTSSDSWKDLTNKGSLTIPKNLYYKDGNGKMQPLNGTNICIGGFSEAPLFLRGDKVQIESGYKYYNEQHREIIDTAIMFTGYVTKVHSKIPIQLDLEDNMWKLKQVQVPTMTFTTSDTLEDIMKLLIKGTGFTTTALTVTNFGEFQIGGETAAQVLKRLQKTYGFEFYFRGDDLRGGILIYIESEAVRQEFRFQKNIISDELEYWRKDDIVLSVYAHNTLTEDTGHLCKDGSKKTKKKRLAVLVTIKNGSRIDTPIAEGDQPPENIEGERTTFFDTGAKTVQVLADNAYSHLIKYYYDGFKGTFTTFGIPFVRQGDNASIKDPVLPERDGLYKIKAVDYAGGVNGLRQTIHIDYRINV